MAYQLDISNKPSPHSNIVKIKRVLWGMCYLSLFRISPNPCKKWRVRLLRLFGAKISLKARVSSSAEITMPWNLEMEDYATIGPHAIIYSTGKVTIGKQATVSQYSYLCTATHDYEDAHFTLYAQPIIIEANAWVAADVFVGPGVTVAEGSVVAARSTLVKSTKPWKVYAGSPAVMKKDRIIIKDRSNEKNQLPNQ